MKAASITVGASVILFATFLTLRSGAVAQPPKQDPPPRGAATALSREDDLAVRKVIGGFEDAWNAHDMTALGKLFRADAQFVNIVGMHWRGRDAIVAAHTAFHETMFKNHRFTTDAIETRALGADHAIAVVTTTNDAFTPPGGQALPKAQNRQSFVLARDAQGWSVVHCQNVRVDADAVKHDPARDARK